MEKKQHNRRERIIATMMACIIACYALAVPISAIVNSPEVGLGETVLYGQSTFPFTVGFVQRDESNGVNYIFATDVGGYGQNNNTTTDGDDIFHWVSTDESSNGSGSIGYEPTEVIWLDQIYYPTYSSGAYRGGYGGVDLSYNDLNNDPNMLPESIIFKADNIYYNPMWTTEVDPNNVNAVIFRDSPEAGYEYMMPTIYLPQIDTTTQKFVGAYSVECSIIDMEGERHNISYSVPIDTSTYNDSIPFLRMDALTPFINPNEITYGLTEQSQTNGTDATILIEQYRGYLDVDYYEYVEPEPEDALAGTWVFNDVLTPTIDPPSSGLSTLDYYMSFSSDSIDYAKFRLGRTSSGVFQVYYVLPEQTSGMVPCYTSYNNAYWSNTAYKTINITSTLAEVTNGSTLLTWLQANATKQGSTATVATEGTWEKVTDRDLLNQVLVTYPMYDTSNVTAQLPFFETYLSYPDGLKMLEGTKAIYDKGDEIIIPEIDEDMYKDYTGWLGTAVKGFFDTPLLGGMSLGVIVGVLVMFGCAIALLKIFAGG